MNRLGMPSLLECGGMDACLGLCESLGLGFVEMNMNLPWCQREAQTDALCREAGRRGLELTIHLPENLDPCEPCGGVAGAWTGVALDAGRFAARNGIPVMVMHLPQGVYFTLPDRRAYLYERNRARYLSALARFRDAMAATLAPGPTVVGIEHTGFDSPVFREGAELLLQSPAFGLAWDIGHSHSGGYRDRAFHERHLDRLAHMHLHDARGRQNHLPLGTGEVDAAAWLALAGRRGCRVALETKTEEALRQSLDWLAGSRG